MANRILRFILDNDIEGSLQVDDPLGFDEMDLVLTRDEKFFAISSELLEIELGFYSEAKDYLLNILATQSFDNETRIDLDISTDKGQTYEDLFEGILDWATFNESFVGDRGHIVSMVAVRSGFFSRFMNHQDTEIDVAQVKDLYGNTRETINVNSLTLHSQTIRREYISKANIATITEVGAAAGDFFATMSYDNDIINDLEDITRLVADITPATPTTVLYTLKDDDLNTDRIFSVRGSVQLVVGTGGAVETIDSITMQWFVQRNVDAEISIGPQTSVTPMTVGATVNHVLSSFESSTIGSNVLDDEFRVYLKMVLVYSGADNKDLFLTPTISNDPATVRITGDSDFDPFDVESMIVHELGNRIVNSITGVNSRFFSEYLGNRVTQIQSYSGNGCGSYFAMGSGLIIRQKSIADAFWNISFSDYFDGINSIFNLGLVVEDSGGSDRVRIEPKHFFFQSGSPILTLRNVNYERTIATEFIYKKVDTGFTKWKSEDFSSNDDWSTNQIRTSRYATIGTDKDIRSNLIAATYAIESTRRKIDEIKSWRLDNDNFIIALNRSVDGSDDPNNLGTAEQDENFIAVNNILFPSVAYNLRLSPARNFLRWGNVINAGLVDYAGDLWRWQGGEGNQDFESRIADGCEGSFNNLLLEENNDIQWDYSASPETDEQTPLFKPIWYNFTTELSFDEYKTLRDNKTDSFEIVGQDGVTIEVFLWELRYNAFKGQGEFKAIEANV